MAGDAQEEEQELVERRAEREEREKPREEVGDSEDVRQNLKIKGRLCQHTTWSLVDR